MTRIQTEVQKCPRTLLIELLEEVKSEPRGKHTVKTGNEAERKTREPFIGELASGVELAVVWKENLGSPKKARHPHRQCSDLGGAQRQGRGRRSTVSWSLRTHAGSSGISNDKPLLPSSHSCVQQHPLKHKAAQCAPISGLQGCL